MENFGSFVGKTTVVLCVLLSLVLGLFAGKNPSLEHAATLMVEIPLLVLLALGWVFVVPAFAMDVRHQYRSGVGAIERIKRSFLTQDIVDKRLKELAQDFDKACRFQVELQGYESAEGTLEATNALVKEKKEAFWGARKVASELRFIAHDRVSDYLDKDDGVVRERGTVHTTT